MKETVNITNFPFRNRDIDRNTKVLLSVFCDNVIMTEIDIAFSEKEGTL